MIVQSAIAIRFRVKSFVVVMVIASRLSGVLPIQANESDTEYQVLGYQKCIDCHALPAEAWMRSSHARRSLAMLSTNSRALRFARHLGIDPSELASNSMCTDCHGTRQRVAEGAVRVVHGVSCESCHGAAGATSTSVGWYRLHSGEEVHPAGADADRETFLREAGMAGTGDLYSLAVRCYDCHTVSSEEVVRAGHVAGTSGFELTTWFSGEVRHNFAPYTVDVEDEETNRVASNIWLAAHEGTDPAARTRLMHVVGQLADLEVSLRNRAKATEEGTFANAAASRSVAALARLQRVVSSLKADELLEAIAAAETVRPVLFLPPQANQELQISRAADEVAAAAQRFVAKYDGAELMAIEPIMPGETKGEPFQP